MTLRKKPVNLSLRILLHGKPLWKPGVSDTDDSARKRIVLMRSGFILPSLKEFFMLLEFSESRGNYVP